jgi:cell division protein FtsN
MKKLLIIFALSSFSAAFSQITINSNFPSTMSAASTIDADVKINKGTVGNFAKYQLDVPVGYVISIVDAKGGNFTFENQRAKIVWVSVPSDAEFVVKLKVQANSNATSPATFSQKFYYLENNEKKEVEATPSVITIGGSGAVTSASSPVETKPVAPPTPVETKPVTTSSQPVETKSAEPVATTPAPTETKPVETTPVASTPIETKPVEPVKAKAPSTTSVSEAGMTFKVQIGAFSSQPNKSKYNGLSNVTIDLINGMYKVTVGKFNSKDEAVKYRDELKSKGFDGFIAKYKDGVRIN